MKHISENGKTYEIGEIKEIDGDKTYDIIAILDFNVETVEIVGFYFGKYNYKTTEAYIKKSD